MQAAIPNAYPFLEYSIDQEHLDPWTKGLFQPLGEVKDGQVKVPDAPGWGVTVSHDWLEKSVYTVSASDN